MTTGDNPRSASAGIGSEPTYDVYLAAPMDGVGEDVRATYREDILRVRQAVQEAAGFRNVYCDGESGAAIDQVLAALRSSGSFLALYPENGLSAVLVEVGIAVAEGLPIAIFTRDPEALPFPLGCTAEPAWNLRCYRAETMDEVIDLITRHVDEILGGSARKVRSEAERLPQG